MTEAKTKPAGRAQPDWERIEADYRAGIKTLREIGLEQGISHAAIAQKAKRSGWERDLREKIAAKAEALVTKAAVTSLVTNERAVVEANAEAVAGVAIRHREDFKALRDTAMAMLEDLIANGRHKEMLQKLTDILANSAETETERSQLYKMLATAAGVQGRIGSIKALAETITKLSDAERVAWKLDKGADQTTREMSDLEVASKLAHFVDVGRRRAPPPIHSPAP